MSSTHDPSSSLGPLLLLPSELLHSILLRLSLPDLLRLRSISRHFLLLLHPFEIPSSPWLFLLLSLPPRRSLLRAFDPCSNRWFTLPACITPSPSPHPLYLLAASSRHLLFASNSLRRLLVLDFPAKAFLILPDSPLGPRDTSFWRRSGLKLVSDQQTNSFRFYFTDLHQHVLKLFHYHSDVNAWGSINVDQHGGSMNYQLQVPRGGSKDALCLHVVQSRSDSFVLRVDGDGSAPMVYRPMFNESSSSNNALRVYGDGNMAIVRSVESGAGAHMRVVSGVELWGLSCEQGGGREWELVSRVDGFEEGGILAGMRRRPYGVMMGCLEERPGGGVVRLVLVANCKGLWDLTWLNFDLGTGLWEWVPVPDCGSQGLNMAGIAVSSSFSGFGKYQN